MAASSSGSESVAAQVATAWLNVTRARERAEHQQASAERHERLAAETGRPFHRKMADTHRRMAACHLAAARLQESYARRVTAWLVDRGARPPVFMAGVAEACGARSAALTLVGADLNQLAVAASSQSARSAQDLEYVLGAGPAVEATRDNRLVAAAGPAIEARWPCYGSALAALGVAAVVAVPLRTPAGSIGALTVFDPRPGWAESGIIVEVADALSVGGVLLGPDGDPGLYGGADHRPVVHQAAGRLAEQQQCSISDALALIKARAFATGEPLETVAQQITLGATRLE
ncbi:ANTAR domain-containing protein [Nocardia sp. NBC_01327]|uniref:ANTAR domain-containing protein n=1 Tax=Nocardia sp. NBC_01327 TaxID=2903593 RepID=UPI002E11F067|nr:ANTAR domain-containing protein [Nocardia sp. NBC_01327]